MQLCQSNVGKVIFFTSSDSSVPKDFMKVLLELNFTLDEQLPMATNQGLSSLTFHKAKQVFLYECINSSWEKIFTLKHFSCGFFKDESQDFIYILLIC